MNDYNDEITKNMSEEDPWLRSENGKGIILFVNSLEKIPGNVEMAIWAAEADTADPKFEESPALYCVLGCMYQSLKSELPNDFKLNIEKLKLERKGEQVLLKCMDMEASEIADLFSNEKISFQTQKGSFEMNPKAAMSYMNSRNIASYLRFNNTVRTYHNFNKSLELSHDNPTVFKHLIEPQVLLYMTPFVIDAGNAFKHNDNVNHGYPLIGILNDEYRHAKTRVSRLFFNNQE